MHVSGIRKTKATSAQTGQIAVTGMALICCLFMPGCAAEGTVVKVGPMIAQGGTDRSRDAVTACLQSQLANVSKEIVVDTDTTPAQTTVDVGKKGLIARHPYFRYTIIDGERVTTVTLRTSRDAFDFLSSSQASRIFSVCTAN